MPRLKEAAAARLDGLYAVKNSNHRDWVTTMPRQVNEAE